MVFHDRNIHGPMRQELIVTPVTGKDSYRDNFIACSKEHSSKINAFNKEHMVFFTQETNSSDGILYTSLLYADKTITKKEVPSVPIHTHR